MDKGISLYFGKVEKNKDYKIRFDKIKQYGFKYYITTIGSDSQNGNLAKQTKYAKKIGLIPSSLHSKYNPKNLHYFWEKGIFGYIIYRDLIRQVKIAKKLGYKCLVVHSKGSQNKIGLLRLQKILKVCNKISLPLALENIDNYDTFKYIFDNITDPMLKVCYDSGHENFSKQQSNFLEEYLDKIICLHLHDNYAKCMPERENYHPDLHSFIGDGNINWKRIAKQLKNKNITLDIELLMHYKHNYSYDELLQKAMQGAQKLDIFINESTNFN